MTIPPDDRSRLAKAYQWSTRIMAISLEMILPGLVGFWIDQQLGTILLFLLLGLAFGCTWGIWHIIRLASEARDD